MDFEAACRIAPGLPRSVSAVFLQQYAQRRRLRLQNRSLTRLTVENGAFNFSPLRSVTQAGLLGTQAVTVFFDIYQGSGTSVLLNRGLRPRCWS